MVTFSRMNCVLTSKLSPLLISLLLLLILLPRRPSPPKIEVVNFIPNMVVAMVVDALTPLEAEAPLSSIPALLAPLVLSARFVLRLVTLPRLVGTDLTRISKSPPTNLYKLLLPLHHPLWTRLGTQILVPITTSLLIMVT